MSILEANIIDGIAKSEDDKKIILLITDHLSWENEYEHLSLLQDKINAYLGYIESKQYAELYEDVDYEEFIIEIHFKYHTTINCLKFIDIISNQLFLYNIGIKIINV